MKETYHASFNELENHWWRRGRRDAVVGLVERLSVPSRTVVDVGCGSGDVLASLAERGYDPLGIDLDSNSVEQVRSRGIPTVRGDAVELACRPRSHGLLVASDVLEHIPDDRKALAEWHRVLEPDGYALVFVPAFEWLWSSHDDINNHQRRYTADELRAKMEEADFVVEEVSYWNLATSPVAVPVKLVDRVVQSGEPQVRKTAAPLNYALYSALRIENTAIGRGLSMPFGTSVFAVGRRAD